MLSNNNDDDDDEDEGEEELEKENWYRVYTDNKKVSVPDANLWKRAHCSQSPFSGLHLTLCDMINTFLTCQTHRWSIKKQQLWSKRQATGQLKTKEGNTKNDGREREYKLSFKSGDNLKFAVEWELSINSHIWVHTTFRSLKPGKRLRSGEGSRKKNTVLTDSFGELLKFQVKYETRSQLSAPD